MPVPWRTVTLAPSVPWMLHCEVWDIAGVRSERHMVKTKLIMNIGILCIMVV